MHALQVKYPTFTCRLHSSLDYNGNAHIELTLIIPLTPSIIVPVYGYATGPALFGCMKLWATFNHEWWWSFYNFVKSCVTLVALCELQLNAVTAVRLNKKAGFPIQDTGYRCKCICNLRMCSGSGG